MRFAALRAPWYKGYLTGGALTMAGDNFEHAITYWAMWQAFHSPVLAGFAVVAHWTPHLLFGMQLGGIAPLRSNDAIHLAAAMRVGVDELVTFDAELADAATRAGIRAVSPVRD